MGLDAFHRLPRIVGFKYEYWDGRAKISISHSVCVAAAALDDVQRNAASRGQGNAIRVERASPSHRDAIHSLWVDVFDGSLDYASAEQADRGLVTLQCHHPLLRGHYVKIVKV